MATSQAVPQVADGAAAPSRLKLAFSEAADNRNVSRFFDPDLKSKIDPHSYVVKRDAPTFNAAIARKQAVFLYDPDTGEAYSLTMAYHAKDPKTKRHMYTENGTSITRLAGYKSAQLVVSALNLSQWWNKAPKDMIVAEIKTINKASLGVYRDKLGWKEITDSGKATQVQDLCDASLDPSERGKTDPWYYCPPEALPKMAQTLLDYLDNPTLHNKYNGHSIGLDLSALEGIGLTRGRLEAIAGGMTDRRKLRAVPRVPVPAAP